MSFLSDYGLYAAAVIYIRWVLHLLSHAGVAAVLCYILQVNQQSLTTFAHSCVFFPPENSPMADLRCVSTAINLRTKKSIYLKRAMEQITSFITIIRVSNIVTVYLIIE